MGWKDLFRSTPPAPPPDPRIHWFGKLPDYADYYRSPSEQDWTVEFIDWMLKGYQIYQSRLGEAGQDRPMLPPCGLALRLPKSRMTVFASIRDYGGDMRGRPFPLCLFAGGPTSDWPGPTSSDVGALLRVLGDLHALHSDVATHLDTSERLETLFGGRELDLRSASEATEPQVWTDQAKSVGLADWLGGLGSDLVAENGEAWLKKAAAWGNNLAKLHGEQMEATLRVPLSAGVPARVQVAGWLAWLETRLGWSKRSLSLVVSGDLVDQAGHLSVVARILEGEDFLLATPLAPTLACVDDLTAAKLGNGLGGLESNLELAGASWLDFAAQPRTPS